MKDDLQSPACRRCQVFGAEDRSFKFNEVLASKNPSSLTVTNSGVLCVHI